VVEKPKVFPPTENLGDIPKYRKRFSGYGATHYRVQILESSLNESQKRYSEALVEIQVASVLMHAWSEVEHDLVYKPLQGNLSEEEYAILDELNGLVLAGEIALERLQRAGELRASKDDHAYTNHYDLAASLVELTRPYLPVVANDAATMGKVDLLYEFLKATNLNTPSDVAKYLNILHTDLEKRPLADQVIDQILEEDPKRYQILQKIPGNYAPITSTSDDKYKLQQAEAIAKFIKMWVTYESRIKYLVSTIGEQDPNSKIISKYSLQELFQHGELADADRLRRFRNQLVHGREKPNMESINAAISVLRPLLTSITKRIKGKKK
jgi:hypothetical protein